MKIEAVLFDIYGTLLFVLEESIKIRSKIISDFLKAWDIDADPEAISLASAHRMIEFSKGEFEDVCEYFGAVISDITGQDEFDDTFLNELVEVGALESEARLFPGVCETLDQLKKRGIKLGIVSNSPCFYAMRDLEAVGIRDYFDAFGVSSRWGIIKPDPEIFLKAASSLGVEPQNILVVGNDPVDDIRGARLAGMRSALLARPVEGIWSTSRVVFGESEEDLICEPDYIIEDTVEILTIIERERSQDI
ncbi:MAG: HAD family hydrolase [Candidatus Syntropharchaeales archaeon]|nr:HAD family hydrolase [Candidatus Syntrophoarchaeum sp.]